MAKLVIEPGSVERQYWRDLWRYRELFGMLAWRDVMVRYKQTVIGIAWAVLRPVFTMVVFTIVFGQLAKLSSEGNAPYPLMVFAAMLPWQLFASAVTSASDSLLAEANLVSKVYFPRLLVPSATTIVAGLDFAISLAVLGAMMLWYHYVPPVQIIAIVPLTLLAVLLALGPGLFFCATNVKYRDFRYALPFIIQLGLYVTPIGFSSSIVPERWHLLFECNPMVGIVDGFRWAILGSVEFPQRALMITLAFTIALLWLGVSRFRAVERTLVDVI